MEGDYVLRNACRRDFLKRKRIYCTTDQIVVRSYESNCMLFILIFLKVSHGAKQALAQAILAVVKPFSRVIVPHPHWPVFLGTIVVLFVKCIVYCLCLQIWFEWLALSLSVLPHTKRTDTI